MCSPNSYTWSDGLYVSRFGKVPRHDMLANEGVCRSYDYILHMGPDRAYMLG